MLKRILSLIKKEFIQLKRNTFIMRMVILMPIIQMSIFGYAAILEVNNINIGVLDKDLSSWSRELKSTFQNSTSFTIKKELQSEKEILPLFRNSEIQGVIIIPPDFEDNIRKGKTGKIQLIMDGVNSNVTSSAVGNAAKCINAVSAKILRSHALKSNFKTIRLESRYLYNPSLNNKFFFIPGVLAMVIMVIGMPVTAMSIVREKEEGTYEQLIVTPIKPVEVIIGKTVPLIVLMFIASAILILVALFWFKLPLRGSLLFLETGIIGFLINVMGIGILVSAISSSQQQAALTCLFILMPFILFSGFIFPIDNMPPFFKILAHIDPMTHMLNIARTVFLKGTHVTYLLHELASLYITGVLFFTASITLIKKRTK